MAICRFYGKTLKLLDDIIIQCGFVSSNKKTAVYRLMHLVNYNLLGIVKKRLFLLLLMLITSFSLYAQTREQIDEWQEKGDASAEKANFKEAIHYYELAKEAYGKLFSMEDVDYS